MAIKKSFLFQILFVFLIIALLSFMLWMIVWLKGESSECVANPLSYYAQKKDQVCDHDSFYYDVVCLPIDLSTLNLTFPQLEG